MVDDANVMKMLMLLICYFAAAVENGNRRLEKKDGKDDKM